MKTEYILKSFDELKNSELYQILKLRNEVFIVEQNCPYQDIDDKDQESFHVMGWVNGSLAAYARILPAGISYNEISIGRIVTGPGYRGSGLGKELVEKSLDYCQIRWGNSAIRISAQLYLLKFYQSLGFKEVGEEYDEDGIPHIEMIRSELH